MLLQQTPEVVRRTPIEEAILETRTALAMTRGLGVFSALVLSGTGSIAAQQIPEFLQLELGSQVRATHRIGAEVWTVRGVLESASASELVIAASGSLLTIPDSALLGLDVSRGRSRSVGALRGLGWGIATGAIFLSLMAVVSYSDTQGPCMYLCAHSRGDAFKYGAAVGGMVGAPIGLTIGAVGGYVRWETVR